MSYIRKSRFATDWVVVAPERAARLDARECPFCPGNEAATHTEITRWPQHASWAGRVVPNAFPVVGHPSGRHEVIIESTDHDTGFADFDHAALTHVLTVWADRIRDMHADPDIQASLLFKNHGAQAGASIDHCHSQLVGLELVPPHMAERLAAACASDSCLWCSTIERELETQTRIVFETDAIVGLCPFSSRVPFEVWLLPRRHEPWYENAQAAELADLALGLRSVLQRLKAELDDPAYNLVLRSAPCFDGENVSYHWHLEVLPRLTTFAGFEWGTGMYINHTPPESAAIKLNALETN